MISVYLLLDLRNPYPELACIVTMTKSNEIARTFVIADAFYNTIKYGITRFIVGT